MKLRHLRYFLVLADELHFGRAAARLAMTQPPLSLNIRQLEEAVGTQLFERDSKGVRLTAAGAAFRGKAQDLLVQADEARALARSIGAGAAGSLRIGFIGSMLFRGLPQWFGEFQARHPGIAATLRELSTQEQVDALMHDELDLGFIQMQQLPPGLQTERVHTERFLCCLPASHALARRRSISLSWLRDEPFVLFSRKAAPDHYARIIESCTSQGFAPQVRHEVRHWLSVVSLVGQGMGVSIVPAPLAQAGIAGTVFKPIAEAMAPSEVFAVWKSRPELPARSAFLDVVLRAN
ncbi:MAG: LysR family transcriptional regulator [Paucibacter sp.]|nr:LysR family transcriptional regulator [Roseateles sp.]